MANCKFRRKLIAGALALAMAGSVAGATVTTAFAASSSEWQGNIDSLTAEQNELQSRQKEVAKELEKLKADKAKQAEYKKVLDEQMVTIQNEVNVINQKIKTLDKKIKEKKAEIADDEKEITHTFNQLKERIRALYLAGEASTLEILLSADSVADFADKAEVMRSITNHDAQLIDKLKRELAKVKKQKEEIEQDRQKVADAKTELEHKQKETKALVEESNAVIAEINESTDAANSLKNRLEAEFNATSDELTRAIKKYNAALSREEREARKDAAEEVKETNDSDYNPDYTPPSTGEGNGTAYGQFIWPAPGTTIITSGVGPRWGTNHNGIDISSGNAYGSPIVASDGGTVVVAVHSGWGGGYGLHVMIDHGNGYLTVYGHASSVIVNQGQRVSQGQTIGYIGSTGNSTGPHLHFEIRKNGAIMDPEHYVRA